MRTDFFKTTDRGIFPDGNNEHGTALTLAYILRPKPRQRLTLELLHVASRRPERIYLGLPATAQEVQVQASCRFFF